MRWYEEEGVRVDDIVPPPIRLACYNFSKTTHTAHAEEREVVRWYEEEGVRVGDILFSVGYYNRLAPV